MMKTNKVGSVAYAKAGVDLNAGDVFSAYAGEIASDSFNNSNFVGVLNCSGGHFRGPRGWWYKNLPKDYFHVAAPDGIGTATIIISAAGANRTASSRLLAMTAGDITRHGGLPLVFVNILEVKSLGKPGSKVFCSYKKMMAGLVDYAKDQGYVLIGGETAEMGVCVSSEFEELDDHAEEHRPIYNWSGVMLGINHHERLITGEGLKTGHKIIALRDDLGSNGGSMMRRYFRQRFGPLWYESPEALQIVENTASPAKLYDKFLATMNGWYDSHFRRVVKMHAIAHISGGGIRSKFAYDILFRRGLSARLHNLWEPPKFMSDCVRDMKIGDEEAYTIFNGGQRALVVIDDCDVDKFIVRAAAYGIEATEAGVICRKSKVPRVTIVSKFTGKEFSYP